MKKTLLFLSCAGALNLAACSQEKTVDTTATTPLDAAPEATYRARAGRIARQMADDMKITDTAVVARTEDIYYSRSRRLGELQAQYATDTTGRYSAMQAINTETDTKFQTVFSDPAQYQTYTANRMNYAEERYVDDIQTADMSTPSAPATGSTQGETKTDADGGYKTKYEDGTKVKVDANGDTKIKNADGSVLKIDENGDTKIKDDEAKIKMDPSGDTKLKTDAAKAKRDASGETKLKEE